MPPGYTGSGLEGELVSSVPHDYYNIKCMPLWILVLGNSS